MPVLKQDIRTHRAEARMPDRITLPEQQPVTTVARIQTADGTDLVQADLAASGSSIEIFIYDLDSEDPTDPIASDELVIADVVYDTLQTDGYWNIDSEGYNFRHTAPGHHFAQGGHRYRIEYVLTLGGDSGNQMLLVSQVTTTPRLSG